MDYKYLIPLIPGQNQRFTTTLSINGVNHRIELKISFNQISEIWWMDVNDPLSGEPIACGIPLVMGNEPAEDLLAQMEYLGLGGCSIIPVSSDLYDKTPGFDDLGVKWVLLWGYG